MENNSSEEQNIYPQIVLTMTFFLEPSEERERFLKHLITDPNGLEYIKGIKEEKPHIYEQILKGIAESDDLYDEEESKKETHLSKILDSLDSDTLQIATDLTQRMIRYSLAEKDPFKAAKISNLISIYFSEINLASVEYWSNEGLDLLKRYTEKVSKTPVIYMGKHIKQLPTRIRVILEAYVNEASCKDSKPTEVTKYNEYRNAIMKKVEELDILQEAQDRASKNGLAYLSVFKSILKSAKDSENDANSPQAQELLRRILGEKSLYLLLEARRREIEELKEKDIEKFDKEIEEEFDQILQESVRFMLHAEILTGEKGLQILKDAPLLYGKILEIFFKELVPLKNESDFNENPKTKRIIWVFERIVSGNLKETFQEILHEKREFKEAQDKLKFPFLKNRFKMASIERDLEFFTSTEGFVKFWLTSSARAALLVLFENDESSFNKIINGLMRISPNEKQAKFFDHLRVVNQLGRKFKQFVNIKDSENKTLEEKMLVTVLEDARYLLSKPPIRVSLYSDVTNENLLELLFKKAGSIIGVEGYNLLSVFFKERFGEDVRYIDGKYEFTETETLRKNILRLLLSPILDFKLTTSFYLPQDIEVVLVSRKRGSKEVYFFSEEQEENFRSNYLDWYRKSSFLGGKLSEVIPVTENWLKRLNIDASFESTQNALKDEYGAIWSDYIAGLEYIKSNPSLLKDLIKATNFEQIVDLIEDDALQNSLLASSIYLSMLKVLRREEVGSTIAKSNKTLANKFEGSVVSSIKDSNAIQLIKDTLRKLGFNYNEEGDLERFENIWRNILMLRGGRGLFNTVTITSEGIYINNPSKSMFEKEGSVLKSNRENSLEFKRKYNGGDDRLFVTWKQIRQVNVTFDRVVLRDIQINIGSFIQGVWGRKTMSKGIRKFIRQSAANIKAELPGRDKPLFEIPAMPKAEEVWEQISKLAEIMVEDDAPERLLGILDLLEKRVTTPYNNR